MMALFPRVTTSSLRLLFCVVCISAPLAAPAGGQVAAGGDEGVALAITDEGIRHRTDFLASDALQGRDTPSPGLEAAAAYIVSEMRRMGLEPGGEGGTYYQRYPFFRRQLDLQGVVVEIEGPAGTVTLALGEDYFVTGGTDGVLSAPVVMQPNEPDGDGAVMAFSLPGAWDGAFRGVAGQQLREAQGMGAVAVVHLLDESWGEGQVSQLVTFSSQPSWTLGSELPFPQVYIRTGAAERALVQAGFDVDAVTEGRQSPTSRITLPRPALEEAFPPNVAAIVRGSDPQLRNEYVILSAHMDHVGVGQPVNGDSIYNGADDNASGTSGLMEVARVLSAADRKPARSVLLLWVSGEEKGLLGSRWYSDHPTVPVEAIAANVNVDMIAGDQHADSVVVIGKDYSSLGDLVNRVNARHPELDLIASDDIWPEQRFFFRSDHFNFARLEIPAIFFFTGVHECYHRPCDDLEFVDPHKAARVANLILQTVVEIANDPERPSWIPAGLEEVRALTR
ncbi:MAG: M28 family peptidase [Gemmatimonadota bacterium]